MTMTLNDYEARGIHDVLHNHHEDSVEFFTRLDQLFSDRVEFIETEGNFDKERLDIHFRSLQQQRYPILPDSELSALQDIFHSLGGNAWKWPSRSADESFWFSNNSNPCTWEGISCTCRDKAINITSRTFHGPNRNGGTLYDDGDDDHYFPVPPPKNFTQSLCNVNKIYLPQSNLVGSIPSSIGAFLELTHLHFDHNSITSSIPESLTFCTALRRLCLNNNALIGQLPQGLSRMTNLVYLNASFNSLSGKFPPNLDKLSNLVFLNIYNNKLSGSLPNLGYHMKSLRLLRLGQNAKITGRIPDSYSLLTSLQLLDIKGGSLTGTIPSFLFTAFPNMSVLLLRSNHFVSTLPQTLGKATNLQYLSLWSNSLSGSIPDSIGYLTLLTDLYLDTCRFSQAIPDSISNLINLNYAYLHQNKLTSSPNGILRIPNVKIVSLYNNYLSGKIELVPPSSPDLYALTLGNNQLSV